MRIQITAVYDVVEKDGFYNIMDDDGMCLTRAEELQPAMHSLASMIEEAMLDPSIFEIQVIDVIGDAS